MSQIRVPSLLRQVLSLSMLICLLLSGMRPARADTQVTDMDESDYRLLGLSTDEELPEDIVPPYPVAKATEFFVHNEFYLSANGLHGNQYYLRDRLTTLTGPGNESHLSDDYGSLRGAYAFYQGINKMSGGNADKVDHGGGRSSYLSGNASETVLSTGSNGFSGLYAQSVAFKNDAGTEARDTSIAELRAYGASSEARIGSMWVSGTIDIELFDLSGNGSRTKRNVTLTPTLNANQTYEGGFKYLRAGYLQELEAVFDLVAADVDGDGADELVCYAGAYEDVGGSRYAIVDLFRHGGGSTSWGAYQIKVYAGKAGEYSCATAGNKDEAAWHQLQSVPVVTLAAGDLDRDGREDVAITCSAPYGKSVVSTARCELYTWRDGKLGRIEGIEGAQDGYISLAAPGNEGKAMVSANCTMGTFREYDSEGTPGQGTVCGLIIAGYESLDAKNHYDTGSRYSRAGYRYVYYDSALGSLVTSDYRSVALEKDGRRIVETAAMKCGKSYRYACTLAPVALACADLKGLATSEPRNDAVLLAGDIYQRFACTVHAGNACGIGPCTAHMSICNKHYNQSNTLSSKDTEQVWIGEVVTGCVSGNASFNESFLAVIGIHRDEGCGRSDDYYWMDVSHVTITNDKLVTGQEGVICEGSRRGRTYGSYVSICLPNVLKNGVRARYVTQEKVYTNPQALAVLQEVPYFSELQDAFRYRSVGSTGFGSGSSTSSSDGFSLSASLGGYFEAELGFLGGGEVHLDAAPGASFDYAHQRSLSYAVSYASGSARGNQVVVMTLPMIYYHYDVCDEATGTTSPLVLTASLGAQTSVVPMELFDQIAARHNMTPMSSYLSNRSGDPASYESVLTGDSTSSDSFGLGKGGVKRAYTAKSWAEASSSEGSSISMSIDAADSTDKSFGVSLSVNANVGGGFKLFGNKAMVGIVFGFCGGYTHVWSSSKSTSFAGTVDNLPDLARDRYGFTWRLGVNSLNRQTLDPDAKVGDKDLDGVWLIGYDLKSVTMPYAPAVTGFAASRVDDQTVELRWDDVLEADRGLKYGIGMLGSDGSYVTSYRLASPGVTSLVWDGLKQGTTYRFVIAAVSEDEGNVEARGIRSAELSVTTLPTGMTFAVAGPAVNPEDPTDSASITSDSRVVLDEGDELTLASFGSVTTSVQGSGTPGADAADEASDVEGKLLTAPWSTDDEISDDAITDQADESPAYGDDVRTTGRKRDKDEPVAQSPTYFWFRKGRGESEWKSVRTHVATSPEDTSVLSVGAVASADDGAQYYCRVGYANYSVDTGTLLLGVTDNGDEGTLSEEVQRGILPSRRLSALGIGQSFSERTGADIEIRKADADDSDDTPDEGEHEDMVPPVAPDRSGGGLVRPLGYLGAIQSALPYVPLYQERGAWTDTARDTHGDTTSESDAAGTDAAAGPGGATEPGYVAIGAPGSATPGAQAGSTGALAQVGATDALTQVGSTGAPTEAADAVVAATLPLAKTADEAPKVDAFLMLGLAVILVSLLAARRMQG